MKSKREQALSFCAHCGSIWADYWQLIDAADDPDLIASTGMFDATCSSCGHICAHEENQVVTNWSSLDSPLIIVAGEYPSSENRKELVESVLLQIDTWCDVEEELGVEELFIIGRSDWGQFQERSPEELWNVENWEGNSTSLNKELGWHVLWNAGGEFCMLVASTSNWAALSELLSAYGEEVESTPFQDGAHWYLAPRALMFGPRSLFTLLIDLVEGVGAGQTQLAWEAFERARKEGVEADFESGIDALGNPTLNPLLRIRAARVYIEWLTYQNAPALALAVGAAIKTQLEHSLWVEGHRKAGDVFRAANNWVQAARESGNMPLLADALAKRAGARMLIDNAETKESCDSSVADLRESLELAPPDLNSRPDQERLGNLAQCLFRQQEFAAGDYKEPLRIVDSLLAVQTEHADLAYNLGRRGSMRLNWGTANDDLPTIEQACDDLGGALLHARAGELGAIDQTSVMIDLFHAQVTRVGHVSAMADPDVIQDAISTREELLGLELQGFQAARAYLCAADLEGLMSSAGEEAWLYRALSEAPRTEAKLRRDIADRLGHLFYLQERWAEAGTWFGAAFAIPSQAPNSSDWLDHGGAERVAGWRPDRSARWASYAFAKANQPGLAVEFLEAALASSYSGESRFEALNSSRLEGLNPRIRRSHDALLALERSPEDVREFLAELAAYSPAFTRVDREVIAAKATARCPIVYVNPNPHGTVVLILSGIESIDVLELPSVTGGDVTEWATGFNWNKPSKRPKLGLMFQDSTAGVSRALSRALPKLGKGVAAELATRLKRLGAERFVLVDAGYMSFLPLHAAPYQNEIGQLECLADWLEVVRVPCASMLYHSPRRPELKSFVGIGDAISADLEPLLWASWELESARKYFPPDAYFKGEAEEATLSNLQAHLSEGGLVHLAVHTAVVDGRSAFIFSDSSVPVAGLSKQLPTTPSLVVAASCSSGRIDLVSDLDDVVSLPSDLISSGCPTVIGTQWPVDDVATALTIAKFLEYHFDGGENPATALTSATRWLRQLTRGQVRRIVGEMRGATRGTVSAARSQIDAWITALRYPFSDPAYWAAFVIYDQSTEGDAP